MVGCPRLVAGPSATRSQCGTCHPARPSSSVGRHRELRELLSREWRRRPRPAPHSFGTAFEAVIDSEIDCMYPSRADFKPDYGYADGTTWLIMEFCDSGTLQVRTHPNNLATKAWVFCRTFRHGNSSMLLGLV